MSKELHPNIQDFIDRCAKQAAQREVKAVPKYTADEIREAWLAAGTELKPDYVADDTTKLMFKHLFTEAKGIYFHGAKGIGKSLNMLIYQKIVAQLMGKSCACWEVTDLVIKYQTAGQEFLEQLAKVDELIINDFGIEPLLNDYGTKRNLIVDLLYMRYSQFQQHKKRTIMTSNKHWNHWNEPPYGNRLTDRFNEMFIPIHLTETKSKR